MYEAQLENKLIIVDIVDVLQSYCAIQVDIDETKVKAAQLMAIQLDLKRLIKKENVERCINPATEADETLKQLVIVPLCYFTYGRLLKQFPGTFTDSGFITETEAEDRGVVKSTANEYVSIGETFMEDVFAFLEDESTDIEVTRANLTPNIRVFGGEERRGSN